MVVQYPTLAVLHQTSLSADLSSNIVMRETSSRENRDLLPTRNRVHAINRRNTRLNHFRWIYSRVWVDRFSHNIQIILCKDSRSTINGSSGPVEHTPKHILRYGNVHNVTGKLNAGVTRINTGGSLKNLDDGTSTCHLEDLSAPPRPITQSNVDNLRVLWLLHIVQNHQRAVHPRYGPIIQTRLHPVVARHSLRVHAKYVLPHCCKLWVLHYKNISLTTSLNLSL
mmetsp:Transcript_33858/g.95284  ORF Transcript_33858/g.95284 Transcript_33858/m.95284 type:complete len:225 (-) Transcript_33858:82-756(-)